METGPIERKRGRPKGLGKAPGSGRKKGSKNKYTAIREELFRCYHEINLPELVRTAAATDPVGTLKVLVSLLPKQIEADVNGQLTVDSIVRAMDEADERLSQSQ
jgi:hypothetical protein